MRKQEIEQLNKLLLRFQAKYCDEDLEKNIITETLDIIDGNYEPSCDICGKPEDADGRCGCTNSDSK